MSTPPTGHPDRSPQYEIWLQRSMTPTTPAATGPATDRMRRTARMTGVLYLLTFVSIPTLALYRPVRDRVDFVLGAGSDTGVLWGAFCEVVVALACVGTAVVLFPVAKRQSETAALGFVTARVVEAGLIIVGVVNVLSIVTLRRDVAGTDGADPAALHGRSGSGCGLRLGVPSLAEPDARGQRAVPGIRDVPVTAGAPHPARGRTSRSPAAPRVGHRDLLRRL